MTPTVAEDRSKLADSHRVPMRLVLLAVLVLSALPADAQRRRDRPFAERGDVALLATLNGLDVVRLSPALGGVGVRYRLADQTVLGTSLGLSVFSADADGGDDSQDQRNDQDAIDATLSVWVEQHVGRRRRTVSPFVGAGVQVGGGTADFTSDQTFFPCGDPADCGPVTRTSESERRTLRVAGGVFVGAEVRLAAGVTLGGAYTFGVRYTDTEDTARLRGTDVDDDLTFDRQLVEVGTGTTGISLSVYL